MLADDTITVFRNTVLFKFNDETVTSQGIRQFRKVTDWGFDLGANASFNTKEPQWATVLKVGPEVKDDSLVEGAEILIEPLQWTESVRHLGNTFWATDEDKILVVKEPT